MDQGARTCDTRLAGGRENSRHDALHRLVNVGIVENNVRGFSAKLQSHALQAARRELIDVLAGLISAGKRNLRNIAMGDQGLADFRAESGHNVDDSGREAGALKPAPEPYLMAARLLGASNPLVVEDSPAGIASGRAAGFEVLAVQSPGDVPELVRQRLSE